MVTCVSSCQIPLHSSQDFAEIFDNKQRRNRTSLSVIVNHTPDWNTSSQKAKLISRGQLRVITHSWLLTSIKIAHRSRRNECFSTNPFNAEATFVQSKRRKDFWKPSKKKIYIYILSANIHTNFFRLTLPMLRLLLFKEKGCKDFWKTS